MGTLFNFVYESLDSSATLFN